MPTTDVLIAGAGIIGLSSALALARSGLRVTVIERARAMGEASWAAAGMLAAHDPENPPALRPLSDLSLALYPSYLIDIESLSSRRVPIRTTEALQGTRPGHHFESHLVEQLLTPSEIESRVAGLRSEGRQFLSLSEHSLDPRDLCAALPPAAIAAGVILLEETSITALHCSGDGVAVATTAGAFSAGAFVNCAGAWAAQLAHDRTADSSGSLDLDALGLEPRKGQIVTVRLAPQHSLDYVVRTPETYLVPRGDGRVVIGATVERAGFDKAVHADVVQTLIDEAAALWPAIAQSSIVETWAGLRPGSADGLPVLSASGHPRCFIASGHFRNGILLAPATARMITQLVRGEVPDVAISAFAADRISAQTMRP